MLTILRLKQCLGQKPSPKDKSRQEEDCVSIKLKEVSLGSLSSQREDGTEIFFSDAFSVEIHWASILLLKLNLMETQQNPAEERVLLSFSCSATQRCSGFYGLTLQEIWVGAKARGVQQNMLWGVSSEQKLAPVNDRRCSWSALSYSALISKFQQEAQGATALSKSDYERTILPLCFEQNQIFGHFLEFWYQGFNLLIHSSSDLSLGKRQEIIILAKFQTEFSRSNRYLLGTSQICHCLFFK